ncbi:LysR family transcriptional regulator [Nocardia sp. NPDC088792]|uniref:LysR family transcriptional regulator n=1 Tax=Nocardia sp. NPDC088792 TaxID=3364332 RepID=UPI00380C5E92
MERRHLEIFLAVVDHGGFTKAAEALYMAQPSLSQTVRTLERELGCSLFTRGPRGTAPTAAGRALVEPARSILRGFTVAGESVRAVLGLEGGRLDIAAPAGLTFEVLASQVGRLRSEHPLIECVITEVQDDTQVVQLLTESAAELAFLYLTDYSVVGQTPGIEVRPLGLQQMWLVAPPGSDLPETVPYGLLQDLPLVMPMDLGPGAALMMAQARSNGLAPRPMVTVESPGALAPMVLAGAGCTLLARHSAQSAAALGAEIRQFEPGLELKYGVALRTTPLSPAAAMFLDYVTGFSARD